MKEGNCKSPASPTVCIKCGKKFLKPMNLGSVCGVGVINALINLFFIFFRMKFIVHIVY